MVDGDRVVIVGGGVAGLGLANALALRGRQSLVIERRPSTGDVDRGDVLHPATVEILRRWKLSDDVRERGVLRFSRFSVVDNDGQVLFDFDAGRMFGPETTFTSLRHPEIEDVLERAAVRTGRVEVLRGVACSGLIEEHGRVRGVIVGGEQHRAPLVVLATGAGSKIVESHFGMGERHDYGTSFLNLRFRRREQGENRGLYLVGRRGIAVVVPLPHDEVRIGLQFHHRRGEPPVTRETALARLQGVVPPSLLHEIELIDLQVYRLARHWHRTLWRFGLLLIGDAAHRVHPVGGQGMNLALADAELLAQCIDGARADPEFDAAAQRFSKERTRQILPVLRRTHMLGVLASLEWTCFDLPRRWLIRALDVVAPAKRWVMKRFLESR